MILVCAVGGTNRLFGCYYLPQMDQWVRLPFALSHLVPFLLFFPLSFSPFYSFSVFIFFSFSLSAKIMTEAPRRSRSRSANTTPRLANQQAPVLGTPPQ